MSATAEPGCKYRGYRANKASNVEWLGDVPQHWDVLRLKYSADLVNEKVNGASSELPYTGLEHIESWTGKRLATEAETSVDGQASVHRTGDVLFGKLRPYLAKAYAAGSDGICTGELLVLRPKTLLQRFLRYYLLNQSLISVVDSSTYGAKMPRASWDFIGSLPVLVAPIDEQRGIVRFLDRETARIDAMIEKKRRQIELLHEKRAALIGHAVTKGLDPDAPMKDSGVDWLGPVPAQWQHRKLGYLVTMEGGCTPSKANPDYWTGDIPWVSPKDMKTRVVSDSEDHVSEEAVRESSLRLLDPPVVLMVVRGMILAHTSPVALTTVPVTINQDMKALRAKPGCSAQYLAYLLEGISSLVLALVEESAHGTKCLRTEIWKGVNIFLPSPAEQVDICEELDRHSYRISLLVDRISLSIDRLHEYRAALISAAVTGKINVQEAST